MVKSGLASVANTDLQSHRCKSTSTIKCSFRSTNFLSLNVVKRVTERHDFVNDIFN